MAKKQGSKDKRPTPSLRDVLKAAQAQGWRVVHGRGGHYKLYPADGVTPFVTVSATPSSGKRSWPNTVADLRRAGLDI